MKRLDSRALNQTINEDKYQMPNRDNLLEMVAEKLDTELDEAWFSSVDMTYAYGQVPLHQLTANFHSIGGERIFLLPERTYLIQDFTVCRLW